MSSVRLMGEMIQYKIVVSVKNEKILPRAVIFFGQRLSSFQFCTSN